ncbi:MAG: hypothetical protein CMJ58_25810 [Planctomycetaceae bacterium]|nr:hypothetical protein [Planctomycetaceae bacterium]
MCVDGRQIGRAEIGSLATSFAAWRRLLERPRAARIAVLALLAIHTGLLMYSAYVHSPTLNEPGHLVAGLSHWKFGRFELYRINPPLVRMVAALPVMAVGYKEDWSRFYEGPGAMPVFGMGKDFVAANGERTFFLTMIARWACVPLSWIGALTCYLWARDLFGRPAGVMACAIWCFEPNILAHASLITPDAHASALGVAACYTFWKWLCRPTWGQAALTGAVLGLAELAKTTLILLYPLWPLMWLIYRWPERREMTPCRWTREAGMLFARMAIGLYVLNLGYGFEQTLRPLGEFRFVSDLLTGRDAGDEPGHANTPDSPDARGTVMPNRHNRFADTIFAALPVPLPANYVRGIDTQQRDFEHHGRPAYLRGEWRDSGWWYYYLYAAAIKLPFALLLLFGVAAILAIRARRLRHGDHRTAPRLHSAPSSLDLFVLLFPPTVIFTVVSAKTGINEHFRYALPALPGVFIAACGTSRSFLPASRRICLTSCGNLCYTANLMQAVRSLQLSSLLPFLLGWAAASSFWIFPHSLSYFNESIGGPLNGPNHLLGSNVDWGQDGRYLKIASQMYPSHEIRAVALHEFDAKEVAAFLASDQPRVFVTYGCFLVFWPQFGSD